MYEPATIPTAPLVWAIRRQAVANGYVVDVASGGLPGMAGFCEAVFGDKGLAATLTHLRKINPTRADRLACALRLHPYEIWGEAWLVPFSEDDEVDEWEHQAAVRAQRLREYHAAKKRESDARKRERAGAA